MIPMRPSRFIRTYRPALHALTLGLSALLPFQAKGQVIVDSYTAEITPQDRVNSRGSALRDVGAILAQDRANFHRFGIRHPGDSPDSTFDNRQARANMPQLVARGDIAPAARAASCSRPTRPRPARP